MALVSATWLGVLVLLVRQSTAETVSCSDDSTCKCSSSYSGETCTLELNIHDNAHIRNEFVNCILYISTLHIAVISCSGKDQCKASRLTCRLNDPCIILCDGETACGDATLDGEDATDVDILCNGKDACKGNTDIKCGSGKCTIECNGGTSCVDATLDIGNAYYFLCTEDCPSDNDWDAYGTLSPTTAAPAPAPTQKPSKAVTPSPTPKPSTPIPSDAPTKAPTPEPTTGNPTGSPTPFPSPNPTTLITDFPTAAIGANGDLITAGDLSASNGGSSGSISGAAAGQSTAVPFDNGADGTGEVYGVSILDILMVPFALIVGSCCCLMMISIAYYQSKKDVTKRNERNMSIMVCDGPGGDGLRTDDENRRTTLPAPKPRIDAQVGARPEDHEDQSEDPLVTPGSGFRDSLDSTDDEVDKHRNALPMGQLPVLPQSLSVVAQNPNLLNQNELNEAPHKKYSEGGEFVAVMSSHGSGHFKNISVGSSLFHPMNDNVVHGSEESIVQRRDTPDGHTPSGNGDTKGFVQRFLFGKGGDGIHGNAVRSPRDSLDDIDSGNAHHSVHERMHHHHHISNSHDDIEIVFELDTPQGQAETNGFIGGRVSRESVEDIDLDENGLIQTGVSLENQPNSSSSEDAELVTIGSI